MLHTVNSMGENISVLTTSGIEDVYTTQDSVYEEKFIVFFASACYQLYFSKLRITSSYY